MLLGQSFQMNETFSIPLPKNAEIGDFKVEMIFGKQPGRKGHTKFDLTSLQVPTFNKLYLLLGNKSVVELLPNGDVFEVEETFPANVKGYYLSYTCQHRAILGYKRRNSNNGKRLHSNRRRH